MAAQQRSLIFWGAIVLAVIFAIIGVLYWTGSNPIQAGTHHKYAALFFVLAVVALLAAYMYRPGDARA
jgi:hypothetical protein